MSTQSQTQASSSIWDRIDQAKKESGRYIKLQSNEKVILQFNTSKIEIVDSVFEGKKTGGKTLEYTVIDPTMPEMEKIFAVSINKADSINAMLKKGISLLEIQKLGAGKESRYIATPV